VGWGVVVGVVPYVCVMADFRGNRTDWERAISVIRGASSLAPYVVKMLCRKFRSLAKPSVSVMVQSCSSVFRSSSKGLIPSSRGWGSGESDKSL